VQPVIFLSFSDSLVILLETHTLCHNGYTLQHSTQLVTGTHAKFDASLDFKNAASGDVYENVPFCQPFLPCYARTTLVAGKNVGGVVSPRVWWHMHIRRCWIHSLVVSRSSLCFCPHTYSRLVIAYTRAQHTHTHEQSLDAAMVEWKSAFGSSVGRLFLCRQSLLPPFVCSPFVFSQMLPLIIIIMHHYSNRALQRKAL
jgi:hypothetical protein